MQGFRMIIEFSGRELDQPVEEDWFNKDSWVREIEDCVRQAGLISAGDHLTSTKLELVEEEVSQDIPDLTCPYCEERMVRAHWEIQGDWRVVWICSCKPDPAILEAIQALREKTGECVIAMFGT